MIDNGCLGYLEIYYGSYWGYVNKFVGIIWGFLFCISGYYMRIFFIKFK